MEFASIRIITTDVDRMAAFYEQVLGAPATRPAPVFAQFVTAIGTLAIADAQTMGMTDPGTTEPRANRSVIIEFRVDDPDADYARLASTVGEWVLEPTTMPWGNRSILFRDPDGNPDMPAPFIGQIGRASCRERVYVLV